MTSCIGLMAAGLIAACGGGSGTPSTVMAAAGLDGSSGSAGDLLMSTTLRNRQSGSSGTYTKIADENGTFQVGVAQSVRFGTASGNRWLVKSITGQGVCTAAFFGGDPAPGRTKVCEAAASASAETTAPTSDAGLTLVSATTTSSTPTTTIAGAPYIDVTKLALPSAGTGAFNVSTTTEIAPPGDDGAFRTSCTLSHMAFDDPIVFPGQPGRSHLHSFFGNTGTNAATTADSLRTTGNSTCRGGIANRSSYWVPTLIDTRDGTPIKPDSIGVYYKSGQIADTTLIHAIPTGLRMIAGDSSRTSPAPNATSSRFKCIGGPNNENDKYGPAMGNCDVGAQLYMEVFFPQCWDGANLDSPDHKSHMSYEVQDQTAPYAIHCPASHPVAIPKITFNVIYSVTEKDAPLRWRLSSDMYDPSQPGGYSAHGDWFNGWRSDVSDSWALNCIRAKKDCHSHLVGDGRMIF